MLKHVELEVAEAGEPGVMCYRIAFDRLSASLQAKVMTVFTNPRKPAKRTSGCDFYKLSVTTEDDAKLAAEYDEDSAHPNTLDMLDMLMEEVRACAAQDAAG